MKISSIKPNAVNLTLTADDCRRLYDQHLSTEPPDEIVAGFWLACSIAAELVAETNRLDPNVIPSLSQYLPVAPG